MTKLLAKLWFSSSCLLFIVLTPVASAQERQQGRALTLSEALELAEKRSESIGIARAGLARAEGDRRRARSAYFPQLDGSASYQRTLQSQFSALDAGTDTSSTPTPSCDRFVAQPGLPIDQRSAPWRGRDPLEGPPRR